MAMADNHTTRREFLETSAATAGLAILEAASDAHAQPPVLRVRRNLGKLNLNNPQDKKVLDQYTQGVRVLRQRSAANRNDQRGWAAGRTAGNETLATAEPRYEVGTEPFTIALKVPPPSHARIIQALAAPPPGTSPVAQPRLLLVVEGIAFEDNASEVVEVFLNAPNADGAMAGGGYNRAGTAPPTDISSRRVTRVFDVTETIRQLRAAGHWNESEIRVTLIRRSLHPGKRPVEGKVTFSRATIRTAPAQ